MTFPNPPADVGPSLFDPPRNCWRVARADRVGVLSNSHYFQALAASMKAARRTIFLSGWDLDAQVVLQPEGQPIERVPFRVFLRNLLEARPELQIRILLWNRTIFYGGITSKKMLKGLRKACDRFDYRFVSTPIGASHHQKLVAIDDHLAYIGGIDLASDRWDVKHHPAQLLRRRKPDGEHYGPIHDVQMAVEGPVATAAADLFRFYWERAGGAKLPPSDASALFRGDLWPRDLAAEFTDIPIAIARNDSWSLKSPIREVEALNRDALGQARRLIYMETQYLTAKSIGASLLESLRRPVGPEIVIILSPTMHGVVEQFTMGNNRDRLLRGLYAADRFDRLHVYYPAAPCVDGEVPMKIHAKLIAVDDAFLRIGSSNLNNRSLRLDTECDLALEAQSPADRSRMAAIRQRLVAELLCCEPDEVAKAEARLGSLNAAIAELDREGRLKPLEVSKEGPAHPMPGTAVLDPMAPITLRYLWRRLMRKVLRSVSPTLRPATLRTSSAMANTTSPMPKGMKK